MKARDTGVVTSAPALERAAEFIWRHARLLERALFACRFRDGPADAVRAAVRAYRNADGGFGHALEPDVRAPDSMPLHCELALAALEAAGIRHPELAGGICAFLDGVAEPSGRVPVVLPAVLDYPRADHWNQPVFTGDSINPTGALVGLLTAQGVTHAWLERATAWCWERVEQPIEEAHDLLSALTFLRHAPDRERAAPLASRTAAQAEKTSWFLADPAATRYGLTPLTLCPTPDALGREAFADGLIEAHLDALAARQQDDGGWPISFQPPSEAARFEWRGRWTLDALETLRAYGRL
jgi:hypothetical protein